MLYLMLPAFNEEHGLTQLLPEVRQLLENATVPYRVVVVNDGSADGTSVVARSYAQQMPVEVIDFPENRGIAAVLRAGVARICQTAADEDLCVILDADNTMSPEIILEIISKLKSCDVVIASRYAAGGSMTGVPPYRMALSHGARLFMRVFAPLPGVQDYSSFYRGYRIALLKRLLQEYGDQFVTSQGFAAMTELLFRLKAINARFTEVPLLLRYEQKRGSSGIRIARTINGYVRLAWKYRALTRQRH